MLYSVNIVEIVTVLLSEWEKDKNKTKKRPGLALKEKTTTEALVLTLFFGLGHGL